MLRVILTATIATAAFIAGCSNESESIVSAEPVYDGFTVVPLDALDDAAPKTPFEEKFAAALETTKVPSALAGAFVSQARSYLSGRSPTNELEQNAFAILESTNQSTRDAIERTISAIDALPPEQIRTLYGDLAMVAANQAITAEVLANEVAKEIVARIPKTALDVLSVTACGGIERAGFARATLCPDIDNPFPGLCNAVCRLATDRMSEPIRTGQFVPALNAGDYLPAETERACEILQGGGFSCESILPPNCKGDAKNQVCLAVPTVAPGEVIHAQGYNFFSTEAKVIFGLLQGSFSEPKSADVFVCGDQDTPATATLDCSINDRIAFQIPSDLAPGRYRLSFLLPNDVGDPEFTRSEYGSQWGSPIIDVLPPSSSTFSIRTEVFASRDETSEIFSDEIGLRIGRVPVTVDGNLGEITWFEREFGNLDQGDQRDFDQLVFQGTATQGVAFAVIGYEIDLRSAYEQQVTEFQDAFQLVLESNWNTISVAIGGIVGTIVGIKTGNKELGAAIATAIAFALNSIVALWAPADLVISDFEGLTFSRVSELTSVNFPDPEIRESTNESGIKVRVSPCKKTEEDNWPYCETEAKAPNQYRELRRYRSDKQGSTFHLTLRYNRDS